jgi:GMP synthase-like glutamine amidotransferase
MTRSLIVNCFLKPSKIGPLPKAIKKFSECTIIQFGDLHAGYQVGKDIDAVVISGSEARIVNPSHRDMFAGTVNLIKHLNLPVFSICYGHQLVCWSLGARVASLHEPVKDRFEKVRIVEVDEIFADFEKNQTIPLAQWHYDYVLRESLDQPGLVLLADSYSCEVEAVKHKHNPFYGVQFHPERVNIKGQSHLEGYRVIENFYRNVVKR